MSLEKDALPPIVDHQTWRAALDELRKREKAATRELDAIAAQRRRLPMVELPDYTLIGADGPIRLADVFEGRSQLKRAGALTSRNRQRFVQQRLRLAASIRLVAKKQRLSL